MKAKPHGFLPEPVVTFDRHDDRDDGPITSAYIQLRDGVPAVRAVQPDPKVLVYFLLAGDGLPVGIRLHEPAGGVAVCEIVDTLIEGPDGPEGVDRRAKHHYLSAPEIRAVLRGMRVSIEALQSSTC